MACEPSSFDGFALSPGMVRLLAANGLKVSQCRWRYGDIALRKKPFEPHVEQAGKLTTIDGRVGQSRGEGFNGTGWFPGDHNGCLCRLVPIFTKA